MVLGKARPVEGFGEQSPGRVKPARRQVWGNLGTQTVRLQATQRARGRGVWQLPAQPLPAPLTSASREETAFLPHWVLLAAADSFCTS